MGFELDLFFLFRRALVTVCTVYAAVRLGAAAWRWVDYLSGSQRETVLLRRYIIIQLVRLRLHRFTFELAQILVLAAAFLYVVWLHHTRLGS